MILFNCKALAASSSCTTQDDTGTTIQFAHPAQRIISLAPDITENLFAIGADSKIVGVIKGSDYPAAAKQIPIVGSYTGLDLEKIVSLHPDLIITWEQTFSRQLAALKQFHIPMYIAGPHRLTDIPRTLRQLGCLTGNETQANKAATTFTQQLSQLQKQYQRVHKKPIRVFYQIGSYSLFTINHDSWINDVIELCGGENIFADLKTTAPEVSWEAVVMANPEVVINDNGESAVASSNAWKAQWQRYAMIAAVKNDALFTINPDLLERASPRLILGAKEVCNRLNNSNKNS